MLAPVFLRSGSKQLSSLLLLNSVLPRQHGHAFTHSPRALLGTAHDHTAAQDYNATSASQDSSAIKAGIHPFLRLYTISPEVSLCVDLTTSTKKLRERFRTLAQTPLTSPHEQWVRPRASLPLFRGVALPTSRLAQQKLQGRSRAPVVDAKGDSPCEQCA